MATLNLFPARIRFTNADGTLTPEAFRALQILFDRVGGALGDNGMDVFGNNGPDSQDMPLTDVVQQPASNSGFMPDVVQPIFVSSSLPDADKPVPDPLFPDVVQPVSQMPDEGLFKSLKVSGALTTAALKENAFGNIGIGVVPGDWRTGETAVQIGPVASFSSFIGVTATVRLNSYNNLVDRYLTNGPASHYVQYNGTHYWEVAPTGVAGQPISFGAAKMLLDNQGNLSNAGSHTIGTYTLATRPAHAGGKVIYVSDGAAGANFQGSNGSAWVNLG